MDLKLLLGAHPDDHRLLEYLKNLSTAAAQKNPVSAEIKSYPDAVYFNYFAIGLSLLFAPKDGYRPSSGLKLADLRTDKLLLDSLYIYNVPKHSDPPRKRTAEAAYSTYPVSPITLSLNPNVKDKDGKDLNRPAQLNIGLDMTGKQFVVSLGEPDRKGGGTGPSSGSIGIWCEWSKDGIMVEFGGEEAQGPHAWERGKDAVWKIITMFPPAP